jgi:hypothetical protein
MKSITQKKLMLFLFQNAEFRKLIIDLNTIDQLYNQGVDSRGVSLGDYTAYTKSLKQQKGERYDHITLKDTGEFYKSFRIIFTGDALQIIANPIKDDTNLFKEFGIDIVGLTEDSMSVVITKALQLIKPYIKQQLLK